jgi:hypothetical protein
MAIIQPSQLATGSYSLSGSFSGSFQGNGSGLTNIPSSAIVGLSSTQIASGAVTASVSTGTGSFTVTSGSSTFMFVSSSGNVGIGTSSPSARLDVRAQGALSTDIAFRVRNSADSLNIFVINGLGNASIGQGTTTLNNRFLVQDVESTSVAIELRSDQNPRVGSTFNTSRILSGYLTSTTSFLDLQYAGGAYPYTYTTGLRLNSNGNIGINTTTDAGFTLDVNGTARVSGLIDSTNTFTSIGAFSTGIGLSKTTLNSSTSFSNLISIQGWARSLNNTSYRVIGVNGIGGTDEGFGVQSIERAVGVNGHVAIGNGNKTVATAISLNATAQSIGTGNTITNYYGVFLETSLGAGITNKWGVFQQDSAANNHFNGTILLGTTTNIASSILTVESTTQGFLPPRMTTTQRNAIASPAEGLMVYDTVLKRPCFYDGTSWVTL